MTPDRFRRIEDLYAQALERAAEQRSAFLAEQCAGDEALRFEVEALLVEEESAGSFLKSFAIEDISRNLADSSASRIGQRFSHYELTELLGAGGMGDVFKATDTRLGRTVAVKILAEHISQVPEARFRFEGEARTIAHLNHPNICVLHDIGENDGVDFLVMEYLEGVTLAERLEKGALPLEEALKIAFEIGDALDQAHRSGVIHRDVKPANVMLTRNGSKLLDFGVAKFAGQARAAATSSAFESSGELTLHDRIVGTPRYMAPEQFNGQEADARSDIFAFGAVLYEMLTGKRAFEGGAENSPLTGLSGIGHVLSRCLARDPGNRWNSIRDVLVELRRVTQKGRRSVWIAVAAVSMAVVLAGLVYFGIRPKPVPPTEVRFELSVLDLTGPSNFSVSPDGSQIVYVAPAGPNRMRSLWRRQINSVDAQMMPGTEDARFPDWSPDSRGVIFATVNEVKRADLASGDVQTLAPLVGFEYRRSTWNRDGVVVYANSVLRRVPASGGPVESITELDRSVGETYHAAPWFLPDGKHFLYQAGSTKPENRAVYIGSLDSKTRKRLMTCESKAIYSAGYLLFLEGATLVARPFDADRLEFTGVAVPIVDNIASYGDGQRAFYATAQGTLMYRNREGVADSQWLWVDRKGTVASFPESSKDWQNPRFLPDGKRLSFLRGDGANAGIWIYDIHRKVSERVTTTTSRYQTWSPDGRRMALGVAQGSPRSWSIRESASDGSRAETTLLEGDPLTGLLPTDWSHDGRYIVYEKFKDGTEGVGTSARSGAVASLWILPMFGDRKPFPYLSNAFDKGHAVFSPNGRWLAFVSTESGSYQVYVQSFPDASRGKWQITTIGGMTPRWKRDGRELYYIDPSGTVVAVPVITDGQFAVGKPSRLFTIIVDYPNYPTMFPYDAAPDGQRFLIGARSTSSFITVVLNWASALKR